MNLSFGLHVKPQRSSPPPPKKNPQTTIFDSSDSDSESASAADPPTKPSSRSKLSRKPPTQPPSLPRPAPSLSTPSTLSTSTLDPLIYDYDTFHASKSAVEASLLASQRQDALSRKPKYITALLSAAAQRKQDQALAKEKALQRERDAEDPDAFKDTETFVTEAYKQLREANARVEAEEAQKREAEEERRRQGGLGSGLGAFYKGVLGEQERVFEEKRVAAERALKKGVIAGTDDDADAEAKSISAGAGPDELDLAAARERGVNVLLNEDGEVADKRQLLSAGLNVGRAGVSGAAGAAEHLRSDRGLGRRENAFWAAGAKGREGEEDRQGQRERQTRLVQEQLEARLKRKAEEEEREREKLERMAKTRKTEEEVMGARERYLARKREREEAAKKGG